MAALRSAPSRPGRVAAAHTVTRETLGEIQARLEPEQAAKISVPVLLLTGEKSAVPQKREVGAVAAALPDAQVLVLAGQQHVADILDPATFAKHLLGFLRWHVGRCSSPRSPRRAGRSCDHSDDQDHLVDLAHHRGAGQVSTTVATIIKVLSPVQIEYSARRRRSMTPKTQAPRSSPGDDLEST